MEKKRRAERLIALLRWLVISIGVIAASDSIPLLPNLAAVVGAVALYNGIQSWCLADAWRFAKYGRKTSLAARVLDTMVITYLTALSPSDASPVYLLYWFVMISYAFASSSLRRLSFGAAVILILNTVATMYSMSGARGIASSVGELAIRTGALIVGALVAAYISKSRFRDELASDRGSYLNAIQKCGARLTSFKSVHEVARFVLSTVVGEVNAAGGQLLLMDEHSEELECEASFTSTDMSAVSPSEESIRAYARWVVSSGRELVVHVRGKSASDTEGVQTDQPVIAMPLLWQTSTGEGAASVMGILIVWGVEGEDFAEDAVDILRIFAAISAAAMVNLRLYTNLQKSFLATLQSLAKGLEARDEYTRGHSDRVTQVACMIAEQLGVSADGMELLRNASLLHDIGKIGVADSILRKAGKLTAEEWESMRRHPVVSEEICVPLGLPPEVLFLVKHHHERLDGHGYPDGLPDKEQPLLLRILVVADSFDAMRSRRPYRDVMPEDQLRAELTKCAGRTLDPTVVDALLKLVDAGEMDGVYELHDRMTSFTVVGTDEEERKAA